MFNTSEVGNEFNFYDDFLSSSLRDDSNLYSNNEANGSSLDQSLTNTMGALAEGDVTLQNNPHTSQSVTTFQNAGGSIIHKSGSDVPLEKARETYYATAADPPGTDTAEERINKLLKAKEKAGLLKPFNYVKGYARLNSYMERNLNPASRQKILRQVDRFRPMFRERMQSLTDIELVLVEMWFERSLMEYDRVFASMAIPACCWRRTGEIFRGNKEMAELIHTPIERLRDV
jgi:hypothetical protein